MLNMVYVTNFWIEECELQISEVFGASCNTDVLFPLEVNLSDDKSEIHV